ncbi:MAG: deoxyribonuclease [Tissierellia bacterium]|nr:deoxyribonuclease [Tissierellia bacterium]
MKFREVYSLLRKKIIANEKWWPHESRFEIIVGAILGQNVNWNNAHLAIVNLKKEKILNPQKIIDADDDFLKELIKPAGFFNAKSMYLKNISKWFIQNDEYAKNLDTATLRRKLLKVKGIGDETADDILIYVYDRSVFIYDLYARRMLKYFGFGDFKNYKNAKKSLDNEFIKENFTAKEAKIFHALIVEAGKIAKKDNWKEIFDV